MISKTRVIGVFFLLSIVCQLTSCSSPKELQYLQGRLDTLSSTKLHIPEARIQKGDLVGIQVFSDNAESSRPFNPESQVSGALALQSTPAEGQGTSPATYSGYLVDNSGFIIFPVIGKLQVEGLTKDALTKLLNEKLSRYLSNPYYDIRFKNFRITLIGEVAKPGVYSIPNERINILEAIGLAGDLTFYGKRDNVLIIRESSGKREFGRVDLRNPELFKSPYYYLEQNDVVLIDMSKRKVSANDQVAVRNISLVTGIVSAIAILVSVLK